MAITSLIIPSLPGMDLPDAQTGERDVTSEYIEKDVTREYLPKPGVLETVWDYAGEFGRQLESSLILAVKGKGGINAVDKDAYDAYVAGAKQASEEFINKYASDEKILGTPLTYKDLAETVSSFPFSFISAGSGIGAGVGTLALTKSPKAAYVAGGAASGAAAYRISSAQVMQSYLSMINDIAVETDGKPLTKEEQEIYRKKFDWEATKYGLWEAIPEAAGNVSAVGIFFKKLTGALGKNLATRMMSKLGGVYGTEIATEAITQHGQHNIEVRAGLQTGEERSMLSASDWWQNIKEVAPQTFILVSVMGAGGGAGVQISARKKANTIVNAVEEGGHEQVPTPFLEQVVKEAQGTMEARPWDKKLAAAVDTLNGELEKRKGAAVEEKPVGVAQPGEQAKQPEADVGEFTPPVTDEGQPKAPTIGKTFTKLSPEYFADMDQSLSRGKDRNGEPFTIADAEALYESYKTDPNADALSVQVFDTVLAPYRAKETGRKTAAVEFSKFQNALDSKTFASDDEILAERERIRQAYPHLADKLNRAVVAYKSAQLQVGKESDQIPVEQPTTITAAGTAGGRGPVTGGIPSVVSGIPSVVSGIPSQTAASTPTDLLQSIVAGESDTFEFPSHFTPSDMDVLWGDLYNASEEIAQRNKGPIDALKEERKQLGRGNDEATKSRKKAIDEEIRTLESESQFISYHAENAFMAAHDKVTNAVIAGLKKEGIELSEDEITDLSDTITMLQDGRQNPEGWKKPLIQQAIEYVKEDRVAPITGERIVTADKALMKKAADTYSADTIAGGGTVRKPFEYEGKKYISTSGASGLAVDIYELIPANEYKGETHVYKDQKRTYVGMKVKHAGKDYILANKIILERSMPTNEEAIAELEARYKEGGAWTYEYKTFDEAVVGSLDHAETMVDAYSSVRGGEGAVSRYNQRLVEAYTDYLNKKGIPIPEFEEEADITEEYEEEPVEIKAAGTGGERGPVSEPAAAPGVEEKAAKQPWEMRAVEVSSKKAKDVFPLEGDVEIVNGIPTYKYRTTVKWGDGEKTFEIETRGPLNGTQQAERLHKKVVQQAIADGKIESHPDYPELAKEKAAPDVLETEAGTYRVRKEDEGFIVEISRGEKWLPVSGWENEKFPTAEAARKVIDDIEKTFKALDYTEPSKYYKDKEGMIYQVHKGPYAGFTIYKSSNIHEKGERVRRKNAEGKTTGIFFDTEDATTEGMRLLAKKEKWTPYTPTTEEAKKPKSDKVAPEKALKTLQEQMKAWPLWDISYIDTEGKPGGYQTKAPNEEYARHEAMRARGAPGQEHESIKVKPAEVQKVASASTKPLIGTYSAEGTEKDTRENGYMIPSERAFKKDLKRYAKELNDILQWEPDRDKKGKDVSVSTNVAPVGGDGHIILWKPGSENGIYISIGVERSQDDGLELRKGGYFGDIMYRAATKKDKYGGAANQWAPADITPKDFAEKIKSTVEFYEQVDARKIIKEAEDAGHTEDEIATAFNEGEEIGADEGATKTFDELRGEIKSIAKEIGIEPPAVVKIDLAALKQQVKEEWEDYTDRVRDEDIYPVWMANKATAQATLAKYGQGEIKEAEDFIKEAARAWEEETEWTDDEKADYAAAFERAQRTIRDVNMGQTDLFPVEAIGEEKDVTEEYAAPVKEEPAPEPRKPYTGPPIAAVERIDLTEKAPAVPEKRTDTLYKPDGSRAKEGDRVVVDGKHGSISRVVTITMRSIFGGGGATTTYSYNVKLDSGREIMPRTAEITFETEKPTEPVIPDILIDKQYLAPDQVVNNIQYSKRRVNEIKEAANRAKLRPNKEKKLREAQDVEKHVAAMQRAFDEWAAKYPEEAEKYRPIKKAGEASAVVTGKLSDFNILVNETTTRGGTPVWNVSGDTRKYIDIMKRLGARWYGPKKVWSFYNEDPSEKILEALAGTKKAEAEAPAAPDLEFAVTGQSKPLPGYPGVSYVVHKRKPDLIPHTYRVVVTRQSPWLTVDGTGMTAEEAYNSALAQYKQKLPTIKDVKPAVVDVIESKGAALERYPIGTRVQYNERVGIVVGHSKEQDVAIRWDGSKQPWNMGVSPLDKDLKRLAAETAPFDGWETHIVKARDYANKLGIAETVEDWTSLDSIVKAINKSLAGKDKVSQAIEAWKVFKETDLIVDKKALIDLYRGLSEQEKAEYQSRLSALQAERMEKKEDPYTAAVGIISGGVADRIKDSKYEFAYGETAAKSETYYDMVGMFAGERADRLIKAGITIRKKATAEPAAYGAANKLVNEDEAAKAREILKKALSGIHMGAPLSPEVIQAGIKLATYHIEAGSRSFVSYAQKMIEDLGDAIRPYLKQFYMAVKYQPGMDTAGMNTEAELSGIDENTIDITDRYDIIKSTERGEENVAAITDHGSETGTAPRDDKGRAEGEGTGPVSRTEKERPAQEVSPGSRRSDDGELSGRGASASEQSPGAEGTDRLLGEGEGPGGRLSPTVGADVGELAGLQRYGKGKDHRIGIGALTRTGSWKDAAWNNLDAIELAKQLETEGRPATPEEQSILAKYVGWGSSELANKMFPGFAQQGEVLINWAERDWHALVERLKNVMTPDEIKTAARSTQYAHYTSEPIIRSIYNILERFGFTGGKMLEPGVGVGNFIGLLPDSMKKGSKYTGIEMDTVTALIAKHLYPQQNIIHGDFSKTQLPKNFFDLAIGNPPFSDLKILADPEYRNNRFSLHEYFFAKSIDRTRPGGLLVFVTSRYAMDKVDDKARKYLAERADLIGAIRLPQTAFKQHAGTEVVTDVIFLRKRAMGETPAGAAWNNLKEVQTPEGPTLINEYFADRPEMILGRNSLQGKMYRNNEYTVLPYDGNIEDHFAKAAENLPGGIYDISQAPTAEIEKGTVERDFNPKNKKEGGLYINDKGQLMQVDFGSGVLFNKEKYKLDEKGVAWLKDYCGLRDVLKQAQYDQLNDGTWEKSLESLQREYKSFVKKHGHIQQYTLIERKGVNEDGDEEIIITRRYKNEKLWTRDVENSLVTSLELVTEDGEIIEGPFLKGRTIKKPSRPEIKTVPDALAVSLDEIGKLDVDHIAATIHLPREQVIEQLGDLIYEVPGKPGYTLADDYLSGDVVTKLAEAQEAAKLDDRYKRNVEALEKNQPIPLTPANIIVNPGSNWIPIEVYDEFVEEVLSLKNIKVNYSHTDNNWSVRPAEAESIGYRRRRRKPAGVQSFRSSASEWGTADRGPNEIFESVLNNQTQKITRKDDDGHTYTDQAATTQVNEIAKRMRDTFASWIWQDAERAGELLDLYNTKFNNIVGRRFDGSHLTLPGVSLKFKLHDHQKRAIWRIIQAGNTYLAHAVGAGKTAEMICAGMEMRRMGLIKKPLYVVPNHMLQQFANEFQDFYPLAHVMVADEEQFHTDNRRRFVAQATLNNPDAVIMTHSSFGLLRSQEESLAPVRDAILQELRESLEALEEEDAGRIRIKRMEKRIEQTEQRFARLASGPKDQAVAFEEMGVDFAFVDEAHQFRKLDFVTNRQAKGITPEGSMRAMDLYIKTKWLEMQNPGRSHVFASGTPVTNTMGELYSLMKFFIEPEMERDGIRFFDSWANMFGQVVSDTEMNAAGRYELVERFSRFVNIPELMSRVRTFMDVLTMSQLGAFVERPEIKGGKAEIVITPASDELKYYQQNVLQPRILASRAWKPSKEQPGNPDPLINIITDGRLASIDVRFVMPQLANNPASKFNKFIDGIIKTYNETKDYEYINQTTGHKEPIKGGSQIVFYNLGLGKQVAETRGFDGRAWIMKRLKDAGIPAIEVAWIDDYDTGAKKEHAMKELRQGKKRILIGSAKKMGTGINVQKRLVDLHYMDPPWYPADVEQPDGRIWRQGNQNKVIGIYRYATKGSYDATQWQMVARKSKSIEQAFIGDPSVRSMEDLSESSQYAMASALASGDERVIRLVGLQAEVEKLARLREAHDQEQMRLRSELRTTESKNTFYKKRVEELQEADDATPYFIRTIEGKIGGRTLENREDFGNLIIKEYNKITLSDERPHIEFGSTKTYTKEIAKLNGVDILFKADWNFAGLYVQVTKNVAFEIEKFYAGKTVENTIRHENATGLVTRMVNAINGIGSTLREAEQQHDDLTKNLAMMKKRLGAPFEFESEYYEKVAEVCQLEAELVSEGANAPTATDAIQTDFDRTMERTVADAAAEKARKEALSAFHIRDKNGEYQEVKGKEVHNDYGADLFVYKGEDGEWAVADRATGLRVGGFQPTQKEAIEKAKEKIAEAGVETFKKAIQDKIDAGQVTPWYETIQAAADKLTDETGAIYLYPDSEIYLALSAAKNNIEKAMPHLEALGVRVYQAGATKLSKWWQGMKHALGDLWDSFKGVMGKVWAKVKEQRGSIPVIKGEDIEKTVDEITGDKDKYIKQKHTEPTVTKDTPANKLNEWVKDETDAFLQTAIAKLPSNLPHMSFLEKWLKSPEWYSHPAFARIVRLFVRDRNELYHEYFNHLASLHEPNREQDTVMDLARELKHKGLSRAQIIRGESSKEYKQLQWIIDYGDTDYVRNLKKALPDQIKEFEDHVRAQGVSEDAIRVWKYYRQSYDAALEILTAQMREMILQIEEEAAFKGIKPADYSELYRTLKGALATMQQWKGFYAPRQRQGNWVVQAERPTGPDTKEYYREHRWSEWAANRLSRRLAREGWTIKSVSESVKLPEDVYQDIKTVDLAKSIERSIERMVKGEAGEGMLVSATKFNEELLQEVADMIRSRGFRSSMIHRRPGDNVVRGYVEDPMERHIIYTNNIARGMAKAKVAQAAYNEMLGTYIKGHKTEDGGYVRGRRFGGIDPAREPRVYTAAKDYIEEQLRNIDTADRYIAWAKSLATLKFLGFSGRAALVNTTAMVVTAPVAIRKIAMGSKGSLMKVHREIGRAGKDYANVMVTKKLPEGDEGKFLDEQHRLGWDDPQYTRDAMSNMLKLHNRAWSSTMDVSMWLFGKTEQWNRGTTMLAAYRIARKNGKTHEEASEIAKQCSDEAHGIYGRATLPAVAWGRGGLAKLAQMLYVYGKFSHNYLQLLYDLGVKKHDIKGFIYGLIAPVVIGGMAAWPFREQTIYPLLGLILTALGAKDHDEDTEKWVWDWTRKHLGKGAEVAGRYGLFGAMGLDISGSLSIGVGIPKDAWEWGGAIGGMLKEVKDAGHKAWIGDYERAAEHILPSGLAAPVRAYREHRRGVVTEIGKRIYDEKGKPYMPSLGETALRVAGVRSSHQATMQARLWEAKQQAGEFQDKRNLIYERYRTYLQEPVKDAEEFKAIKDEVRKFNRHIKDLGLKGEVAEITYEGMRRQAKEMRQAPKKIRRMLQ